MKYLMICLFSVSLLFATVYEGTTEDLGIEIEARSTASSELLDNPDGIDYCEASTLNLETLSDEDPFGSGPYQSPVERALAGQDEGPVWVGYDWADDIEIYPGRVGSGQDFDYDESTGDIYAIFDTDNDGSTVNDSLVCFVSQDNGQTWTFWRATYSSTAEINNPKVVVAEDAGGQAWVCMMYISDGTLRVRRMTPDQSSSTYETVATGAEFADMAGDIGSGAYVYATFVPDDSGFNVRAARNALDGSGWVDNSQLFGNTQVTSYPAIAAGAGGTVAVAFIDERLTTTPQVRIKRSTDYGAGWSASAEVSSTAADNLLHPDIAFNHSATQTGWITVTYDFTASNENCGFYYSTDSGAGWTYGTTFPAGGGTDENLSSIGAMKSTGAGGVTIAYNSDPGDSLMFSWFAASSPSTFEPPVRVNDFAATGFWPATAGWNGNTFSSILYTNWNTNYRLMYDWYNHTGIEGGSPAGLNMISNAPNPFNATTNISFTLTQNSPVTIAVYNVAGQLVNTIADNQSFTEGSHSVQWDAQSLSPGVYFCRLNADGINQTHRMLRI